MIQNRKNYKIRNVQIIFLNFAYIEFVQNKFFLQFLSFQRKTQFLHIEIEIELRKIFEIN